MVHLFPNCIVIFCFTDTGYNSIYLFSVLAMKKFLIGILTFVMVYIVLHIATICVFGNNKYFDVNYYNIGSYGNMFSRINDIASHKNPEILFLGSSHAYRSFDTRIFNDAGVSTFNFGSSSQTPLQTEVLLKKYLDVIQPKTIIFEVYFGVFQRDGIESTTDLISNDHIDTEICKLAIRSGNIKVINTLIYGLYQEYCCGIRNTFQEDSMKDGDLYVSGGFVEKLNYSPYVSVSSSEQRFIKLQPKQLRAFGNCIKMISDEQIPYLLVKAPLPKSINSSYVNQNEFNELMSSYGNYLDFNEIIQLDDSCFYDSDHLSQKGVVMFDNRLIQVIDSLKIQGVF